MLACRACIALGYWAADAFARWWLHPSDAGWVRGVLLVILVLAAAHCDSIEARSGRREPPDDDIGPSMSF